MNATARPYVRDTPFRQDTTFVRVAHGRVDSPTSVLTEMPALVATHLVGRSGQVLRRAWSQVAMVGPHSGDETKKPISRTPNRRGAGPVKTNIIARRNNESGARRAHTQDLTALRRAAAARSVQARTVSAGSTGPT